MMPTQLQLPFLEFKKAEEEREKKKQRSKINKRLSLVGIGVSLTTMTVYFLKTFWLMVVNFHTPGAYSISSTGYVLSATDYVFISVFVIFFAICIVVEIIDYIRVRRIEETVDDNWCWELHCMYL